MGSIIWVIHGIYIYIYMYYIYIKGLLMGDTVVGFTNHLLTEMHGCTSK